MVSAEECAVAARIAAQSVSSCLHAPIVLLQIMEAMILKRRKREEKGGSKQRKEGPGKGAILIKSASVTRSWACEEFKFTTLCGISSSLGDV